MRILIKRFSAILIAAVLLAACSNDSDDSAPEVPETTSSAATSSSAPPTVALPATTVSPATSQTPATTEGTTPATASTIAAPATTAEPAPTATTIPDPLPAGQVNVQVFNGSGVAGAAGYLTRSRLPGEYNGLTPANAPETYSDSVIYYISPEYLGNALQIAESLGIGPASVQRLTEEIAESLGIDIPTDVLRESETSGDALASYSGAHVIVIIGRDQLATSLTEEIAEQRAAAAASERESGADAAAATTTTTTTTRPRDLFPTATTMVPGSNVDTTVTVAPSGGGVGGPPPVPQITFGEEEEVSETPNIRVVVQDGPDEGGRLRYLVSRGSELRIEVLSQVGAGSVRVAGYNQTGATSLFSGAEINFIANRSGVYDVTFTPDSTGTAEIIFQIQVS